MKHVVAGALGLALALVLGAVALPGTRLLAADPLATTRLELDAKAGEFRLFVKKKGVLKAFAHDHEYDVRGYTGTLQHDPKEPEKGTIELRIPAKEVTLLDDGKLSPSDRDKVQATTLGEEILDTKKYPRSSSSRSPSSSASATRTARCLCRSWAVSHFTGCPSSARSRSSS